MELDTRSNETEVFARKPRIMRSPVARSRTSSMPDMRSSVRPYRTDGYVSNEMTDNETSERDDNGQEECEKRKRPAEESPTAAEECVFIINDDSPEAKPAARSKTKKTRMAKTEEPPRERLAILVKRLAKYVNKMQEVVDDNRNTKKEIKDLSCKLKRLGEEIVDAESELPVDSSGRTEEAETTAGAKPEMRDASTQTIREPWEVINQNTKDKIRQKSETAKDIEDLMETLELKWPEGTFKAVKEVAGNPLKDDIERNLSFWKGAGPIPEKGFHRQLSERFPDMRDITDDERKGEEVLCWVYESKRATKEGLKNYRRRTLTYAWKEKLLELGIKRVALAKPEKEWEMYKKLMEYILADTEIVAVAYFPPGRKEGRPPATTMAERRPVPGATAGTGRKKGDEEVVIVKADKPYLEALTQIKEKVKASELGININKARSKRNGEILLSVEKGSRKGETLRREIESALGTQGITARMGKNDECVLHVKGLEGHNNAGRGEKQH